MEVDFMKMSITIVVVLALLCFSCSSFEDMLFGEFQKDADRSSGSGYESAESESEGAGTGSGTVTSGPQWNQLMISQAQMAFSYAFSAGGMWAGQTGYKPGEFTKFQWTMKGETPIVIERACLRELDDGNQWWRVSWKDSEGLWIWESLIDIQNSQMLRMRARDPDGNEGEVPVSGEAVYIPATELTRESVQGAIADKGKVDVPAGSFQADHVVYMAGSDGAQIEFWLVPQIPGGVVKYLISQKGEGVLWNSELLDYGRKAETVLNSY